MDIRTKAIADISRLHLRDAADRLMYDQKTAEVDGVTFQVDDETKPCIAVLYSPGTKQYAAAQARQNNRMIDKLRKKGKSDQTAEQKTAEQAEFLADCTHSFEHVEMDGLSGRQLHLAVYGCREIGFIATQVDKHLGDWANF